MKVVFPSDSHCQIFIEYWLQSIPDPYYDTEGHRRKLPPNATESQKKLWKKIRNMAYKHDRCMFGMNCCDLGVGLAPIACKLEPKYSREMLNLD